MNLLKINRRLIASVLTFRFIFQEFIATQMAVVELAIDLKDIPFLMLFPLVGLVAGLLNAVFISYREPRKYESMIIIKETTSIKVDNNSII